VPAASAMFPYPADTASVNPAPASAINFLLLFFFLFLLEAILSPLPSFICFLE
jgi:hypothetical protein